jgi:peptidoglycan/LPS O-acetylase OafA/YrhL
MNPKSFYIPNLNGLRFLAAFAVIVGHLEMCKSSLGIEHLLDSGIGFFEHGGGHLGVVLFFVLSGFLITLLLLKEKEKFKTIKFRKFLIRRALRIWPVYFLFITIVIFLVHGLEIILETKSNGVFLIGLYYLILPNLAMSGFGSIQFIPHLWSIGVEEQFYIIWPLIIKFFKKKGIIFIMVSLIVIIPLIPHVADFCAARLPQYKEVFRIIRLFFQYFLINSMAVGGLLGFLFHKYRAWLQCKFTFYPSVLIIILCLLPWALGINFGLWGDVIYPLIFGLLILTTSSTVSLKLFENRMVSYLGKISYGIYVYHWIIIYGFTYWLDLNFGEFNYGVSLLLNVVSTIIVATISYELLEKNILKYKSKFALIKSGKI